LCCLWSIVRVFVRAASGRQRFNVLGAWDAVTRAFVSVTNTTVVNTDTMCELLRKIAAVGLAGKILGPLGLSVLIWRGEWPFASIVLCITNDFVWWLPFGLYLWDAWPCFRRDFEISGGPRPA
jgi:hypothetical protein